MKTEDRRVCTSCGNEFSGAVEFCPVCMLREALADGVESGETLAVVPISEPLTRRFEHYELMTDEGGNPVELGRGAMGITYKAFDVDLRCPVTLKVINERYLGDESARLRFLREARAAASVRHPNVASVFHLGRSAEGYFYAMEFVEGETLENLVKRSGRLDTKLALEITAQVAAGLAAVHKKGLVHRDIKPGNIMVSLEEGGAVTAKIIDLGLAKGEAESHTDAAISVPGVFTGTPAFASPEQFAGAELDIRSDLYSLGVSLWKMLTGQVPFRGPAVDVTRQHQRAALPLEELGGHSRRRAGRAQAAPRASRSRREISTSRSARSKGTSARICERADCLWETADRTGFGTGHERVGAPVQQVNINPTNLRKMPATFPTSIEEQTEIIERINRHSDTLRSTHAVLDKLLSLKTALMQDLLTGKKRVTPLLEPEPTR